MSQGQELYYLTLEDVLQVHAEIVGTDRQGAENLLRDRGGLESALNRPLNYATYRKADIALQAAVLAHGIAEGQSFRDANKRTALVALLTFLMANGFTLGGSQKERAEWMLDLSDQDPGADEKVEHLAAALRGLILPDSEPV